MADFDFIGRQKQIDEFQKIRKIVFPFVRVSGNNSPYICFVIGPKRSGKSTLANRMLDENKNWVLSGDLNLPDIVIRLESPNSNDKHLADLVHRNCKQLGVFKNFEKKSQTFAFQASEFQNRIKNSMPESVREKAGGMFDEIVATGAGILINALSDGQQILNANQFMLLIDSMKTITENIREIFLELFQTYIGIINNNSKDYDILLHGVLTELSRDLYQFSQDKKIAFLVNDLEVWPKSWQMSLRNLIHDSGSMLWVIVCTVGRVEYDRLRREWQGKFSDSRFSEILVYPLSIGEINVALSNKAVPILGSSISDIAKAIYSFSEGDPEITQYIVNMWNNEDAEIEKLLTSMLVNKKLSTRSMGEKMNLLLETFLRMRIGQSEKNFVMLMFILGIIWGTKTYEKLENEKNNLLNEISKDAYAQIEQESLIIYRGIHGPTLRAPWNEFIRDWLMRASARLDYSTVIQEVNEVAISCLIREQANLVKLHNLKSYKERAKDDQWHYIENARLFHSFWVDWKFGWTDLAKSLIVSWEYNFVWFQDLIGLLEDVLPILPGTYSTYLELMKKVANEQSTPEENLTLLAKLKEFSGLR